MVRRVKIFPAEEAVRVESIYGSSYFNWASDPNDVEAELITGNKISNLGFRVMLICTE